jgi:hypothetical protein
LGSSDLLPDVPGFFFQIRLRPTRTDAAAQCLLSFASPHSTASILNSLYFSSAVAGKTHDKKVTDDHPISHPRCFTLGRDTGFQEYEPKGVIIFQPKKT